MITISGPTATRFGRLLFTPVRWVLALFGLMRGPVVATRGGITWSLELAEAIDLGLWALNLFEPGVTRALARLLKPGDVVVDIGANVGAHALRMAQRVGDQGRVYAFEPTDFGFQKLTRNLSLNPELAKRVEPLRVGLTDLKERPLPELVSASWSLTRPMDDIHPRDLGFGSSTVGARFVPLDRWVTENGVTRVDLVKLDVDGYETRVIRGALETLRRFKPLIVMEWAPHHFVDPEEPFLESIALLQGLGYSFQSLEGEPLKGSTPEELARIVPRDTLVNVIASPRAE
jgi:FkbM family methyltransferase